MSAGSDERLAVFRRPVIRGKRPRGICQVCGAERALRAGGVVGSHKRMVRSRSGALAYRTGQRCPGVDQEPLKLVTEGDNTRE